MAVASRAAVLMTITVLIADDQPVMRDGLRMILTSQDDIAVVGEAANGNEAVELTADLAPDVILMDIQMPPLDGIEATRRITSAADASRVLILTTFALDEYVFDAFQAGAAGFLVKTAPPQSIIDGVRTVASGDALLAPSVTRSIIERFLIARPMQSEATGVGAFDRTRTRRPARTGRTAGPTRKMAQDSLHRRRHGEETADLARILTKLDLRDRVQAVVYAYDHGLVARP